jgi:hypothetical protein
MMIKPALKNIAKGILHTKEEINRATRAQKGTNTPIIIEKQVRIRKESNI